MICSRFATLRLYYENASVGLDFVGITEDCRLPVLPPS